MEKVGIMASAPGVALAGARDSVPLLDVVAAQGSAAHPYLRSEALLSGPHAARNLADAVHCFSSLHGRHPGMVDHAAQCAAGPEQTMWFARAMETFAVERTLLARLCVAVGPIPSTPGAADTESTLAHQRHALEMLASSERCGCALGGAVALARDWRATRTVLQAAAHRFGVDFPPYTLGDSPELDEFAALAAGSAAIARAMRFGAEQVAVQHFGLWELLDSRQQARADH